MCARTKAELDAAAREIRSKEANARSVDAVAADVSRPQDVRKLAGRISRWGKGLDVLINNASLLGPLIPIAEYPIREWIRVITVNLTGPFLVARALLPLMNRDGLIMNISSSVGRAGRARWGAYAVSKFGLEGLTQVLAEEVSQRGITVLSLNPGGTRTRMRSQAYPDEDPARLRGPAETAEVLFSLAASPTRFPSGAILDIEDGVPVLSKQLKW